MKQNERLLVYAVTGFLALILVIAVLFGNDPVDAAGKKDASSKGLSELLQPEKSEAELAKAKAEADAKAKALANQLNGGRNGSPQQPLNAKPLTDDDIVLRELGQSRRERIVRWVTVQPGDAFEKLVRRWCGSADYLAEAISLNEDTVTLKVGQEVMVPWVDNSILAANLRARAEARLASNPVGSSSGASGQPRTLMNQTPAPIESGMPRPSVTRPGFAMPGGNSAPSGSRGPSGTTGPATGTPGPSGTSGSGGHAVAAPSVITYKVKKGDSIWRIATRRYGKANAYKMVKAIQSMNPGLGEDLKIGQEFKIPAKAE